MVALRDLLRRKRALGGTAAVLLLAGLLQFVDANPAVSQTLLLNAYESPGDPGQDPASAEWQHAFPVQVPLTVQAGSYAAGGGSILFASAKALHYKERLYVRIEWDDQTKDESTTRVQDFSDAVAVEFPAKSASTVPSVCMGQANGGVNIWQWRADSQAGLKDPADVYSNSSIDGYPSKDTLFYTAREAGNPYAKADAGPVQTLIAQAFGTLTPSGTQDASGKGVYANGKWAVVFSRPFAGKDPDQANFAASTRTDMAIAVWNGSEGDRNGRKSVSTFLTLSIANAAVPGTGGANTKYLFWGLGLLVAVTAIGAGLAAYGYREGRRM